MNLKMALQTVKKNSCVWFLFEKFTEGSCLKHLLKNCPKCGGVIIDQKRKTSGSMLSVVLTCHNGHTELWESQPVMVAAEANYVAFTRIPLKH